MTGLLDARGIPFALIGAGAMAVQGVARSTRDLDLLTLSAECLEPSTWAPLADSSAEARIRRGDAGDPLAGVVRFTARGAYPVDLVVGKSPWQAAILRRAERALVSDAHVPVARRPDLVLLKLFAGGPHDAWDVAQLLATPDRDALIAEVEAGLRELPPECRALWRRVRALENP